MELVDFEDSGFEEQEVDEKLINVTFKLTENEKTMLSRISKRERRNMSTLCSMIVVRYIEDYIEKNKKKD